VKLTTRSRQEGEITSEDTIIVGGAEKEAHHCRPIRSRREMKHTTVTTTGEVAERLAKLQGCGADHARRYGDEMKERKHVNQGGPSALEEALSSGRGR